MKERNINKNVIKKVAIVLVVLLVAIIILFVTKNLAKEKINETISLIINNKNVTERLKNDIKIEDGIVYISIDDMENFFDKYIYVEEETNEVITTYDDKIASIGFNVNKMTINGAIKKTNASAIRNGEIIYLPISEMLEVYNVELTNIEEKKTITLDSLDREQVKATLKSNASVKSQGKTLKSHS